MRSRRQLRAHGAQGPECVVRALCPEDGAATVASPRLGRRLTRRRSRTRRDIAGQTVRRSVERRRILTIHTVRC
jgi:hypothetical protein